MSSVPSLWRHSLTSAMLDSVRMKKVSLQLLIRLRRNFPRRCVVSVRIFLVLIMMSSVMWYRRHLGKTEKFCPSISLKPLSGKNLNMAHVMYSPWEIRYVNDDVIIDKCNAWSGQYEKNNSLQLLKPLTDQSKTLTNRSTTHGKYRLIKVPSSVTGLAPFWIKEKKR